MTTPKKPRRCRRAIVLVVSAVILLALTWHFAGYAPDNVISLSGVYPLAITADGATLIAGTRVEDRNTAAPDVVGPIRFLDLATGKDSQAPRCLK